MPLQRSMNDRYSGLVMMGVDHPSDVYSPAGMMRGESNGEDDLNPGVSADAVVLFALPDGPPRNGEGTVLELHGSAFSGGVELHL